MSANDFVTSDDTISPPVILAVGGWAVAMAVSAAVILEMVGVPTLWLLGI